MSGLLDQVSKLAEGRIRAVDLVAEAVERARSPAAANVFTLSLYEDAMLQAVGADLARSRGDLRPCLGVPITVKDNFDLAGCPTPAGSTVLADAPPASADAAVVEKLRAGGMVVLGRTNMTEFAFSGLGLNPHYGTPANPAYPNGAHIPGGSSSGAAVSVALGIVPAAIGTDTGGSVRIPAAFCGLVGFKASPTAISRAGVLPLSGTLDAVGIIAGGVSDCRMLFDLLREAPPATPPAKGPIRLGLVRNYVGTDAAPAVCEALERAVARIAAGGIEVVSVDVPALDGIATIAPVASFSAAESNAWHKPLLADGRGQAYDPRVLARILPGGDVDAAELAKMETRRAAFEADFTRDAAGFSALVWPTAPFLAPRFDMLADDAEYHRINALALRNSSISNLAGGCAISLPCPDAPAGPVGLTLAAPRGADDALLETARQVEIALASRTAK